MSDNSLQRPSRPVRAALTLLAGVLCTAMGVHSGWAEDTPQLPPEVAARLAAKGPLPPEIQIAPPAATVPVQAAEPPPSPTGIDPGKIREIDQLNAQTELDTAHLNDLKIKAEIKKIEDGLKTPVPEEKTDTEKADLKKKAEAEAHPSPFPLPESNVVPGSPGKPANTGPVAVVRGVSGSGTDLGARLVLADGSIVNVRVGTETPNGYRVTSITKEGVHMVPIHGGDAIVLGFGSSIAAQNAPTAPPTVLSSHPATSPAAPRTIIRPVTTAN